MLTFRCAVFSLFSRQILSNGSVQPQKGWDMLLPALDNGEWLWSLYECDPSFSLCFLFFVRFSLFPCSLSFLFLGLTFFVSWSNLRSFWRYVSSRAQPTVDSVAAAQALRDIGEDALASRYDAFWRSLAASAPLVFYQGDGYVREITNITMVDGVAVYVFMCLFSRPTVSARASQRRRFADTRMRARAGSTIRMKAKR